MAALEAVVFITLILTLGVVFITRINSRAGKFRGRNGDTADPAARLSARMDGIERRLENIETLVIEKEKQKAYEAL